MSDPTLNQLAEIMRGWCVSSGGQTQRWRLGRGLTLTLRIVNGDYILSLTRASQPSKPAEEGLCRGAFGVPAAAKRERDQKDDWHIIRLQWPCQDIQEEMVIE